MPLGRIWEEYSAPAAVTKSRCQSLCRGSPAVRGKALWEVLAGAL